MVNEREECPKCHISTKLGLWRSKDGKTFICGHCKAEEQEIELESEKE